MSHLGYTINQSVRFRASASARFTRTPAVAGSRTQWTFSCWVKRTAFGIANIPQIFGVSTSGTENAQVGFNSTDTFIYRNETAGAVSADASSTMTLSDPSAWYHIVFVYDSPNATTANRVRLYVNGVQQTITIGTAISQNETGQIGNTVLHAIAFSSQSGVYLDCYLAEMHYVNGQVLDANSFGEFDTQTGIWKPKRYTGTYGTTGFYLPFNDATSPTTLGLDRSGNGNNWTPQGISTTAGSTYDVMLDSPTNGVRSTRPLGNYATLNPLSLRGTVTPIGSTSNGALTATTSTTIGSGVCGTLAINNSLNDKWYWEVTLVSGVTTAASACDLGVAERTAADNISGSFWRYYSSDTPTYTNGDVISFAYDASVSTLYCYKNNVLAKTITGVSSNHPIVPMIRDNISTAIVADFNFGQRPFTYTPPAGYVSLCSTNMPDTIPLIGSNYFNSVLYTGNGTTQNVAHGMSNPPDLVWLKSRSATSNHGVFDAVRGFAQAIYPNLNNNQANTAGVGGVDTTTISLGGDLTFNTNAATYVAWMWDAGTSNVTNTAGTRTSTVRANPISGTSIVTYSGSGANATVGHGLGAVPSMIIVKSFSGATNNWAVGHEKLTNWNWYLTLNTNNAQTGDATVFTTTPTSTVFSVGTNALVNASGSSYVAYCFAEVFGVSYFGSYIGNGNADGPFAWTGFKPAFILIKNISAAGASYNWQMVDDKIYPVNATQTPTINPNTTQGEVLTTVGPIVFCANGFKVSNTGTAMNGSGNTIIYAAFAENPFKNALAR